MKLAFWRDDSWAPDGLLTVRKLADRSDGERVTRFHPVTGERVLVRPETVEAAGFDYEQLSAEPWPLAGVEPIALPSRCVVGCRFVDSAVAEGWAHLDDEAFVHRPGGPPEEPFRVTHTFRHASAITFLFVDAAVRYRVIRNPDKWPAEKDGELGFGGTVLWTYALERT